jgi:DNA polymerase (family 10)
MSTNEALAQRLALIGQMQELLGADKFRVISHDRAARVVEGLPDDIARIAADRDRLLQIDGIGPKIADKIIEFCATGRIQELDDLRAQIPAGLLQLLAIPGMGPKTVRVLWKDGGVEDLAGLHRIIDSGAILSLPRMGEKSVQKLKDSIAMMAQASGRLPLGLAAQVAQRFIDHLRKVKGVERIEAAGSFRRGRDTIGDIDICVAAEDPAPIANAFRTMPDVRQVLLAGDARSSVRATVRPDMGRWQDSEEKSYSEGDTSAGTIQVDLRVLPRASWGAALMYFTGSKEHNVRLRERAQRQGLTLNEYGLFPEDGEKEPPQKRGVKPLAGATEEEVYARLGVPYLPPEVREDRGELEFKATPRLVAIGDIRAELHAHTTASDGVLSITQLAREAQRRGFHTIAVTDHSKSSAIANGLSPERLRAHIDAVHAARDEVPGITILAGSEVDILADGRLDYDDELLARLDVVVASPHTALTQDAPTAMKRMLRALQHPLVHVMGHPTGRQINRRPGLPLDIAELAAAAREHNVALEINAHWMRLDLRDTHVRAAIDAGCRIAIDCDVHETADFDNLRFGVATARRGWATPESCVNTWPADRLHAWLKSKRSGGPIPPTSPTPPATAAKKSPRKADAKANPAPKRTRSAR